jgi:NAD(P)-dependent dehydrogenase (short-subunit alcohol dehydrogenase family)
MNIVMIGGSHGIGYSYYKKAISKGDNVKVLSRNQHDLKQEDWIEFDILEHLEDDKDLPKTFDSIDALIYLPGTVNLKPASNIGYQSLMKDFELNVVGAFKCINFYHKNLKKSDQPSISLFSSVVAKTGMPFHSSVGICKGAIEGLVKNLAAEFAPKIRVNALALSLIDTPLTERIVKNEKALASSIEKHPLKRIGSADEVSDMLQVLTHFSPWMTGQIITYDGGLSSSL